LQSAIAAAVDMAAWLDGNEDDDGAGTSASAAGPGGRSRPTTCFTA
jgi:hypothetical protein